MAHILPMAAAFPLALAVTATAAPAPALHGNGPGRGPAVQPAPPRRIPPRQAPAQPASTRPATAPADAVDETGVNPAATEFLRAVAAGEDERAYQLTTADYREGRPLPEFKKEMDALRAELSMRGLRFQVIAAPRPAGGGPWRAIAIWPTARKTTRKSVTVGLALALEQGAWRVEHVEFVETANTPGPGFVGGFMKANPGARPVAMADAGMMSLTGRVTKVDDKSLTVEPTTPGKGGPPPAERTLAVDEGTRVLLPVRQGERKTPGGQTYTSYRSVPAKLADVKVGQQVVVETAPGQDRATRISIDPAHSSLAPILKQ